MTLNAVHDVSFKCVFASMDTRALIFESAENGTHLLMLRECHLLVAWVWTPVRDLSLKYCWSRNLATASHTAV